MRRTTLLATALVVWLLTLTATALAAGGDKVGENLGHMLSSWARSLYAGIAGIVAVMFLFNRRFAELAVFVFAAVVVAGFVFAPNDIADIAKGVWSSLTA